MSRRNAVGKARGGADGGGGGRGGGAIQAASAEMDSLRAELLSSLTSVITDTVDMVCEQHEENFTQAVHQLQNGGGGGGGAYASRPSSSSKHASASANGNGADTADYDLFHQCCQRLVRYIDANMTTSPDFAQQMDRVILACHSNASETVLASVVTKKLWLHTKSSVANTDEDDDTREDDDVEDFVELRAKPSRSRAAAVKPELPTARSAKRRVSAPLPPPPPPSSRSAKVKSPVKKRARRESSSRKTKYAPSDDESEEEEEVEASPRKRKRRVARLRYSEEEDNAEQQQEDEEDDDDDDVVLVNKDVAKQPHYGQADELLTFKDAIGDMCYADRRTPAQTRFFKDRLRKAIQFVDAQLCKPPKGKSCSWECAKIRRQMCNRDLPCRNKICRLWHDVEAHTDRCQNTHCEFRIRVMLRETMYKIDHKKMEVQNFRNELHTKKKELVDLKNEGVSDRDNFVERRLLENEIDQLESEIENAEKDLGIFKATRKTYWATLNEIGITVEDDENDQFPNFKAHYAEKKAAAKKKTPIKARASDDYTTSSTPTKSSRSERSRRRQSIDTPDQAASPLQKRERIARRSTQQSLKVLSNGVIELDDDEEDGRNEDEEAKTDRSADEDNAVRPSHDSVDERNGTREDDEQHQEDEGDANQRVPRSADGVEDASAETEAHDEADAPPSTGGTVDETQSADYVIESEETQPEGSTSGMASALEAFNQVVDAHSKPSEADGDASDSGDKAPQTTATTEDENAPLLPF